MLIDCETCVVRGDGCADCVVTVILNNPRPVLELDGVEVDAMQSLASAGLVPPLRLVPVLDPQGLGQPSPDVPGPPPRVRTERSRAARPA